MSDSRNRILQFRKAKIGLGLILFAAFVLVVGAVIVYNSFRIYVPPKHIAVLTRKTGKDLENQLEIAPDATHKGLQNEILMEGRYFRDPYNWGWSVYPQIEIPNGKMGVRIRLYGDDLSPGKFAATEENEKGIVEEVLRPGRYPINAIVIDKSGPGKGKLLTPRHKNDYVEIVELHDPVTIPAGFKGVVTNLHSELPDDSNKLLVDANNRGVYASALDPETYYMNPYLYRIEAIDCRSQRFDLAENGDMGFPSKDGFWVSLDGIIEFRVKPDKASEVYVLYNDLSNDDGVGHDIDREIIRKVIMPNARSFCRLRGSDSSGREFIGGETRSAFQKDFENSIRETCDKQGIEIIQALITNINPPQAIADPVRQREVARQKLKQYQQQKLQQEQEAKLAKETALVEQRQRLVEAARDVVKLTTEARKRQDVALEEANRDKEVAEQQLAAAKDQAEAILAESGAQAAVVNFENEADAAGWKKAVEALGNDGQAFARYVLYQKLAPGYKTLMTNTADSPLMDVFKNMSNDSDE